MPKRAAPPQLLDDYRRRRDFSATSEPPPDAARREPGQARIYVIQKHAASRLHYDFRLELDGTLKSWAIPKGPSLDPADKRLAMHVEDHPLAYAGFEGSIPAGHYGAGQVLVWDRGLWQPDDPDPAAAYRAGRLNFHLLGEKLSGGWTLVRIRNAEKTEDAWLLIKEDDADARPGSNIVASRPESVLSHGPLKHLDKARPAALPERLSPALATLVDHPPPGEWRYEIKFDGYRLMARIDGDSVRLFTRRPLDWTDRLPGIAKALHDLHLPPCWLDGEIVCLDEQGHPDFQLLQNAFEHERTDAAVYYLFDLPFHDGFDLRATPLEERRARLKALLQPADPQRIRYSDDFDAPRERLLQAACELRLEGLIGKRAGSAYPGRRSSDWIKLKCRLRQEFIIGGYSQPQGRRTGFGALLLGVNEASGLRYVGKVGSGFDEASLQSLHAQMQPLIRREQAFRPVVSGLEAAGVAWLEPRLVCEAGFTAWTDEGRLRHAVFLGLREDKPAAEIVRERPAPLPKQLASKESTVADIAISHPDRVIDPETGTTKLELARLYERLAPHLLAHIAGRPLSLLRAPDGINGEQFFQRHAESLAVPGIRAIAPGPDDEGALIAIDNLPAVIGAVQMGVIEFHAWNADAEHLERPDRLIFDLDPDPALPWRRIVDATRLVQTVLDELGLPSFLKTTGGKGMHIVVPITRRHGWNEIKAFSKAVTQHLAEQLPQWFAATMGAKNRVGKIFVDYLRDQRGASTVAAWSVRARPGLPISVPIAQDELDEISGSAQWSIANIERRLAEASADPWPGYSHRHAITRGMRERLGMS